MYSRNGQATSRPPISLLGISLDNKKDELFFTLHTFLQPLRSLQKHVYTLHTPNEKDELTSHGSAGGNIVWLFLSFGGPIRAIRISKCLLGRVLTYKNLIYSLNLLFQNTCN